MSVNAFARLSLGLAALLGSLLPLASKGIAGVGIPVLLEFAWVSRLSLVSVLLYLLGATFLIVTVLELRGRLHDAGSWYLGIGVTGLIVTGISVMEGISHIALFGAICSAVDGLRSSKGPSGPGTGGYLLLFVYLSAMLLGLSGGTGSTTTGDREKTEKN